MALQSMLDVKEGWMAEAPLGVRRYHYIRNTMSLCGGYGFYRGDLVPDAGGPKGHEDCGACFRKLRAQQKAAALEKTP